VGNRSENCFVKLIKISTILINFDKTSDRFSTWKIHDLLFRDLWRKTTTYISVGCCDPWVAVKTAKSYSDSLDQDSGHCFGFVHKARASKNVGALRKNVT